MKIRATTTGLPCLPLDHLPGAQVTQAEADRVLRDLARIRSASDYQLCEWLACGFRLEVHRSYGYASFREYAERVFDFSGRQTEDRLRTSCELASLPLLALAFREGRLCYSVVRELTRVATAESEAEWMARADGRTSREIERMVAGRKKGDRPTDPADPSQEPMRWGLLLAPGNHALMEQVRKHLISKTQRSLTDDELAMLIAEQLLSGGPVRADAGDAQDGCAPFQISLHVCEGCKSANVVGGGEPRPATEMMVAMAECDAQHVGRVDAKELPRATQTIPPRIRRMVLLRHGRSCGVPGCRNCAFLHLHHTELRAEGGTHDPDLLIPLCSAHHAAVHEGRLVIRGSASSGFVFEHADGAPYGSPIARGDASALLEQVFGALRSMGFRHKDAQSIIDSIRPRVGAELSRDEALRMALAAAPVAAVRESCVEYGASEEHGRAPLWGLDFAPKPYGCSWTEIQLRARLPAGSDEFCTAEGTEGRRDCGDIGLDPVSPLRSLRSS